MISEKRKLDSFSGHDELPSSVKEELIEKGEGAVSEIISMFERIDWEKYLDEVDHQPLASGLFDVLKMVVKKDSSVVPVLAGYLQGGSLRVKTGILTFFTWKKINDARNIPFLELLIKDKNSKVRSSAGRLLSIQGKEVVPALYRILEKKIEQDVVNYCAYGLARNGEEKGWELLKESSGSSSWKDRNSVARFLKFLPAEKAIPIIEKALPLEKHMLVIANLVSAMRRHTGKTDREVRQKYLGKPY